MLNGGPMFIKHNMYLYILRYVLITVLVLMSNMDCISTYLMTFFRLTIWRKTRADSTPSCFWWRISISFTWEHDIFSHFDCGVFRGSSEIRWTLKGKSFIIVRVEYLVLPSGLKGSTNQFLFCSFNRCYSLLSSLPAPEAHPITYKYDVMT